MRHTSSPGPCRPAAYDAVVTIELQPGTLVGRYRLVRLIAQGGMGAVWQARDERLEREVAVKVLPEMLVEDPEVRRRFEREARALARLQHPNVVTIYDLGSADPGTGEELPFLVMQLLRGRSLDQIIRDGPMQLDDAIAVIEQVARALVAAHSVGVIHRDLKPSNIMVAESGHVWVLDFGLARLGHGEGRVREVTLTSPGMVLGSCPYMAPEQALGHEVVPASDLFAVGAVLYEAVSGRRAFEADTPMRVLQAVVACTYPPIDDVCAGLPASLGAIVERCLARDPARRYASAVALQEDLLALRRSLAQGDLAQSPTVAVGSDSVKALVDRRRRARLRRVGLAGCAAVVGLVLGALAGRHGFEPRRPDPGQWQVREILELPGSLRHPAWNPAGTELAVDHLLGDRGEVLAVPADGGEARVLALAPAGERLAWPRYSPDGTALVVSAVAEDRVSLQILPVVGGPPIAEIPGGRHAAWIDRRRLVYSRYDDGVAGLRLRDLESGEDREYLAPRPDAWWFGAESRPGGGLALIGGSTESRAGIWTTGRAGAEPRQWLPPGLPLFDFSWARGGRSLVASIDGTLMRVTEDGAAPLMPRLERVWDPAFAPDGARLGAVRQSSLNDLVEVDPASGITSCVLCGVQGAGWGSVGPDGSVVYRKLAAGAMQLYHRTPNGDERILTLRGEEGSCPAVSPDGKAVAYLAPGAEGGTELRVLALGGGEPVTVATGVEGSEYPSWSPDGRFLVYAGGSPINAWVVSPGGGEPRKVSPSGGDYPRWSPDGRMIAYVVWTEASDPNQGAWVVPAEGGEAQRVGDLPTQLGWSRDGETLWQLRRVEGALELWQAKVGAWRWRRASSIQLGAPPPPQIENLPFTVDPVTGRPVLNRRSSTGAVLVFEGVDPTRW